MRVHSVETDRRPLRPSTATTAHGVPRMHARTPLCASYRPPVIGSALHRRIYRLSAYLPTHTNTAWGAAQAMRQNSLPFATTRGRRTPRPCAIAATANLASAARSATMPHAQTSQEQRNQPRLPHGGDPSQEHGRGGAGFQQRVPCRLLDERTDQGARTSARDRALERADAHILEWTAARASKSRSMLAVGARWNGRPVRLRSPARRFRYIPCFEPRVEPLP